MPEQIMNLDDYLTIEEILTEANAYGLRAEVQEWANKLMKEGYDYEAAYTMAFNEWCK